jgi:LmbE family N-acetylglucosaminyl deacetylase
LEDPTSLLFLYDVDANSAKPSGFQAGVMLDETARSDDGAREGQSGADGATTKSYVHPDGRRDTLAVSAVAMGAENYRAQARSRDFECETTISLRSITKKKVIYMVVGSVVPDSLRRAYAALCERLGVVGRPLLLARAEDITPLTTTRSCLVLAPHPDDETLGCGAIIMRKLAAGTPVHIVIATDGRHSHHSSKVSVNELIEIREEESRRAGDVLGITRENIFFLRFEDGCLAQHRTSLRGRLAGLLNTLNPEEIFVSSIIDAHPDHRVLAELARELAHAEGRYPVLYEYPIWFWDPRQWQFSRFIERRPRIARTENFLARKREAIAAYRSQVSNLTGEPDWAITLSRSFLRQFLQPEEIFFEVCPRRHAVSVSG